MGGEASDTAVVWVNQALNVGCATWHGEDGVLHAVEKVRDLADAYAVHEVIYDPWRFGQAALELEHDGVPVVQFPQTDARRRGRSRVRDSFAPRR